MKTVLIHYFNPHNLTTARLFVKTIRVGFPTWEIKVDMFTENKEVITACINQGIYVQERWEGFQHHSDWIYNLICKSAYSDRETLVFCDPDMIFYGNMETIRPDKPYIIGRHCPQYVNEVYQAIEYPRLHTSLLYINKPSEIRSILDKRGPVQLIANENPWAQHLVNLAGRRYFFDTGCCVYQHLSQLGMTDCFDADILGLFTHIHCGTMSPTIFPYLKRSADLATVHDLACTSPSLLRGLWRKQDDYYKQNQNYADLTH